MIDKCDICGIFDIVINRIGNPQDYPNGINLCEECWKSWQEFFLRNISYAAYHWREVFEVWKEWWLKTSKRDKVKVVFT